MPHWSDKYRTPENICARCGHPRDSHLDQPSRKGEPPQSDRGWTTLPKGMCISGAAPAKKDKGTGYHPQKIRKSYCGCMLFVEPDPITKDSE
jgi:hypothetical protein